MFFTNTATYDDDDAGRGSEGLKKVEKADVQSNGVVA